MADRFSAEREVMISRLQEAAVRLGVRQISRTRFIKETGIAEWRVRRAFGSYNALIRSAGLEPRPAQPAISRDSMLAALRDAIRDAGGPIGYSHFAGVGRFGMHHYQRCWGNWAETLAALCVWIERNDPEFAHLAALRRQAETEREQQAARAKQNQNHRRYGPVLNFRGLLHEPVNEQGVVLLFGAVAAELGFVIESIGREFPDCEGKRLGADGTLERVRIEFEHRSRSFRDHEHDPARCDLIVCWEHNWLDCPVEVLELRTRIRQLAAEHRPFAMAAHS